MVLVLSPPANHNVPFHAVVHTLLTIDGLIEDGNQVLPLYE